MIVKRIFRFLLVCLLLLGLAVGWGVADLRRFARTPMAEDGPERSVIVPAGQGFAGVLSSLESAGIVSDPIRFRLLARWRGFDRRVQAGEYRLSAAMTPLRVLRDLTEGRVVLHRLTIPEGFDLERIARAVGETGLATEREFRAVATDPDFAREQGIPADDLEGYLFPDTYRFPRTATARGIALAMLGRFRAVFGEGWRARAEEMGWSVHEIVTLASIVERETGVPEERPLVASVFHNRLRIGMRLQSDPTAVYGLADFEGPITRKHLDTPTPYNTYRIPGLPPGPIASPGRAALEAALFPAETDYLYFVSRDDRTHVFSTNLRDHNRAVRAYRRRR